jgi:hypothetical protein
VLVCAVVVQAPSHTKVRGPPSTIFTEWADRITADPETVNELNLPAVFAGDHEAFDIPVPQKKSGGELCVPKKSENFIWETLNGERKLEQIRIFECKPDGAMRDGAQLKADERMGAGGFLSSIAVNFVMHAASQCRTLQHCSAARCNIAVPHVATL